MANAAPTTYEQEQEKLQRKYDGKEIHIEAPREPEVNPEVYRDVEPILFRGFLTVPAEIGGALFVFKSLNHHEFELLRLSCSFEEGGSYKSWAALLAYGVFMIDGQNILSDRGRHMPKIAEMFGQMDPKARGKIIRQMGELNRRASNAVLLTECFAMESYSRYRWAQYMALDLCSPTVTGVSGTDMLGMNWAQLAWRAINYFDDRQENVEREWDNAKFVASSMAGKGLQKIYQQDNDRRQKDREDRLARKDRVLRQVLLGEKPLDKVKQLQGAVLTGAHTVEDLAKQLEGDLRGEQDWHDRVIRDHEESIKKNLQTRQNQVQQLARQHDNEFNGHQVVGGTDFKGLSIQEVEERVARRKQLEAQQASQRMVRPELTADPKSAEFLDKWGLADSSVDFTMQETDRDPSKAVPIAPPVRDGVATPFRRR